MVCCADPDALAGRLSAGVTARPAALRPDGSRQQPEFMSLAEMASDPSVEIVVSAIVGGDGLEPTWPPCAAGKALALANKEAMVMAGGLLTAAAAASAAPRYGP